MASMVQRTLKTCIPYIGTTLHSGRRVALLVRPAEVNTGVRIVRKDVPTGRGVIPALWHHVVDTRLGTILGNEFGVTVSTVEHLLAALHGCGWWHSRTRSQTAFKNRRLHHSPPTSSKR